MTDTDREGSLGKIVALGMVVGVAAALACVAVLKLMGVDSTPAIVGGVTGGVTGGIVSTMSRRKAKG